jgi:hypothetical protein
MAQKRFGVGLMAAILKFKMAAGKSFVWVQCGVK